MTVLDIEAEIQIERDHAVVRRQFGDVGHHERTGPHRGVRFEVIDDDLGRCRYRQITRLGPVRLHREIVLERASAGPLVTPSSPASSPAGESASTSSHEGGRRTVGTGEQSVVTGATTPTTANGVGHTSSPRPTRRGLTAGRSTPSS